MTSGGATSDGPELWVVRHGETEWSRDGRHTSVTDLPLTETGEEGATALASRLAEVEFDLVLTSPRQRARRTADLAGYPHAAVDDDLVEWGYGDYEGVTTAEIREDVPGWTIWTHPVPGGETLDEVSARLDRVVARAREHDRTLVFAHGHSLRVLTARWAGQPADAGRFFKLDTSTVSVLGFEREHPALLKWNS
jgi:broad specificity phosphatase PhoE